MIGRPHYGSVASAANLGEVDFKPVSLNRRPTRPPRQKPELSVRATKHGRASLAVFDSSTPRSRAVPKGVRGVLVMACVGEVPSPEIRDWWLAGQRSRTRFEVEVPASARPGERVWFVAHWYAAAGPGPWSEPAFGRVPMDEGFVADNARAVLLPV